jgi:hypothetical protein
MNRKYTFFQAFVLLISLIFGNHLVAQNAIIGSGFTSGWGGSCSQNSNFEYFTSSAGTSYISIQNPNAVGNNYFRMGIDWDFGGTIQQNTTTNQQDDQVNPNQEITLNSFCTSSGAMYINATSLSQTFVFKTKNAGSNPERKFIIFRIDGVLRTVNSVSRNFSTVLSGLSPTITANLDASFNNGQGVYLRYTTDGWATSSVVSMTGSGTSYSGNIPTLPAGTVVSYYVFTSGSGMTIAPDKADWYTINLNNNGGGNFQYTVANGPTYYQTSGNADLSSASNWLVGDGTTWVSATSAPTSSNIINILTGHQLTISDPRTISVVNIANTGSLLLTSSARLTVSGTITNDGTITLENGATLVQGSSSTLAGSGNYVVKQDITGAGSSTPTGRFWYLGSPVSQASSAVFFASSLANVVKKRNEATNAWTDVPSGTPENLVVGRGYYTQVMANSTLTFTGGEINNGSITTENLTSAGASFTGFNLVSNPYPSYIDWTTVTKTNVGTTMWYRTHDGSGMNFGTVNGSGVGTTIGATTVTKYIPPMQSFWVRVATYGQPASLTFNNTNRSHFISENSSVAGLKSSNDSPSVFIRMNLKQAEKMDQLIVYTEDQATNGLDYLDAEKMIQATHPQFYTKVGNQKTVINALNASKKQQSLPITMELPTTGVHSFMIEDLEISNGLVWLEDKQEEIVQALEPGSVYEFYANSGINSERFVLHFQLIDDAVPTNVYNEVNSSANFSGKGASVYAESAGVVVIKLPASAEGVTDIQIRDAAGKLVYAGSMNNLETSVELAQANGIYYVTLSSNTGVEVRKVFIQQ